MKKMRIKTVEACLIVSLAIMLVLMSTTPVAMAIPGQLRLFTIDGSYVYSSEDAWLHESYVTEEESFDLDITNHNGADIYHLYLLVAVDRDPAGGVTITVSGNTVSPYDGIITDNNNALVTETNPDYEYPGHGVFKYGSNVHFEVVDITIPDDGKLVADETISVPVEITLLTTEWVKVHFDAVGANKDNKAIAFVPPSEDVTYQVPEFTTIAIPVASILGLLFLFNHRKHKKS